MNCSKTQFANSIPLSASAQISALPQITGIVNLVALAHDSKDFGVSNSSIEDKTEMTQAQVSSKVQGQTARGWRLLEVMEEKRRRELVENLNSYPAWTKVLEDACRNDSEFRAVLGDNIGNPESQTL